MMQQSETNTFMLVDMYVASIKLFNQHLKNKKNTQQANKKTYMPFDPAVLLLDHRELYKIVCSRI